MTNTEQNNQKNIADKPLILVVDDVELNRAFLVDILEDEYRILEAANGEEALNIMEKSCNDISIILLDAMMPVMDGFEFLEHMNKRGWIEHVPVVMISAENSTNFVVKGYEAGVVDYISRPFDSNIIKRRVRNTIVLYAKQKKLEQLVYEQVEDNQRSTALLIDILSTVAEFRNEESQAHVHSVRIITEILLKALSEKDKSYGLGPRKIAEISNAAAMHDVGKIAIPEEVLNKPGRLTDEEYNIMKEHSVHGARMFENLPAGSGTRMLSYAHDICRWHHERWDGKGYPDGLKGNEIPISAQIVSLADVYDALTSERVYKPAFSHEQALKMINNGECGQFNPQLLICLNEQAGMLQEQIHKYVNQEEALFDISEVSNDVIENGTDISSKRSIELLEQERTKYQFLAALSDEIIIEYTRDTDTIILSDKAYEELGMDLAIKDVAKEKGKSVTPFSEEDFSRLVTNIYDATPENPLVQGEYLLTMPNGEKQWYKCTLRVMWLHDKEHFTGCIGKLINIHEAKLERLQLQELAQRDALTGVLNRTTMEQEINRRLEYGPRHIAAFLVVDVNRFGEVNETHGHLFGDELLQHLASKLKQSIRKSDLVARSGGDEFVVYLDGLQCGDEVKLQAERVARLLSGKYRGCTFATSVGYAVAPGEGKTYIDLMAVADKSLEIEKSKIKKVKSIQQA